ncbi:MAG: DNA polymerase III subunit delta' [Clostridiales bacterium]|nr:DNA polymerase III subunit delta' [Clostridiales bacterium]
MDFDDIVGQRVLVESLKNAIKRNMVANAYIFNGPKGSGKKTLADIFARAINCKGSDNKPCNLCSSCKKSIAGVNPDIMYIEPMGNSIKIEQIRKLISDVSVKPFENTYRVIVMKNADSMTIESQDAFLKTLEEPEGNNVFLLLTENYNALLPTIVSRCQVYNMVGLGKDDMKELLVKHGYKQGEELEIAIDNSNGIIGRALEILKDEGFKQLQNEYENILKQILEGSRVETLILSDKLLNSKEDGVKLLSFLLNFFRDILILKDLEDNKYIINKTVDFSLLKSYRDNMTEEELFEIIDNIKQTISSMEFNVSYKNSIDNLFLKILEVFNGKSSRSTV